MIFHRMQHQGMEIVFCMVFSIEKTIDISFILLSAIADGILNNDAFKHCVEENKN